MKYVCIHIRFVCGSFVDETQLALHYFLVAGFLSVLSFKGNRFVENRIINLLVEPNIIRYFFPGDQYSNILSFERFVELCFHL